jgi:hypothetical protein
VWTTLAALGWLIGAASAIGWMALLPLSWPELRRYERIALELTAGLGLTALLLAGLAFAGWFFHATFVLAALSLITLIRAIRFLRGRVPSSDARPAFTILGIAVVASVALACAGAIAPVTDDDALAFGVPCARHIAETGRLQVWSDQARAMFPQAQMVLLAYVIRMGGDRLGAVTAVEWLLCVGVISALARRVCERSEHVAAAIAIAVGSPVAAFQVASAKEDLLLLAAGLASAFCLAGAATPAELAAAGLFAGLAAGVKYPGLGFVIAAVLWTAASRRDDRWRSAAIVAGSAFAAGGLWYVLNWRRFGNPVAPFIFGAAGTHFDARLAAAFGGAFGGGHGPIAFLIAPLRMFVEPSLFAGRANLYNPLAYAGLAGLFAASARRRNGVLFFTAAVVYVGWFFTMQNARLLLPAVALLAPSAADRLVPLGRRHWTLRAVAVPIAAASLGILAAVGVVRAARYVRDPATYLDRESQRYADIRWMNTHLDPARDRVASSVKVIGYLKVPSLMLDPTRQLEIGPSEFEPPERLLAACRRQHITHLFGRADDFAGLRSHVRVVYANPAARLGGVRFFREPPTESTAVYEIIADAVGEPAQPERSARMRRNHFGPP